MRFYFEFQSTVVKKVIGLHSETCPEVVIDLNNKLMVQFAWRMLGKPADEEVDQDIAKNIQLVKNLF